MSAQDGYIIGQDQAQTGQKAGFSKGIAVLGYVQEYTASHGFRTAELGRTEMNHTGVGMATTFIWNPASAQVARIILSPYNGRTNFVIVLGTDQSGAPSLKDGTNYILMVKQDSVGTRNLYFDSRMRWPYDVVPGIAQGANVMTIFSFVCDGTNLYGNASYQYTTT